jgi:hypothetical protein
MKIEEERRQCVICNLEFSTKRKNKIYCTKRCKRKSIDRRRMHNEKRILYQRKSWLNYRNKNLEKRREEYRTWSKTPKGKMLRRLTSNVRNKRVKNQTPPWANMEEIYEIYKKCQEMNKDGKKYSVDHIWPLKGKDFCGLHVPWNLRIITIEENSSKRNKRPI